MNASAETNLILERDGCPLRSWQSTPEGRLLLDFLHRVAPPA